MVGSAQKSSAAPMGEKGRTHATAIPAVPSTHSGRAARLPTNGTFSVRMRCTTRVWVHMLSMNQPAWKVPTNSAWPAASRVPQAPPATVGHTKKKSPANVRMSKTELKGPNATMKRRTDPVSQRRGRAMASSSTLSHGTAVHVRS